MADQWSSFKAGTITDAPLLIGATTINSAAFANLPTIAAPDTLRLILDPEAVAGTPEIVLVTTHGAASTEVTVSRGQETSTGGSVAREHNAATPWVLGITVAQLDELPFRKMTTTGDILIATAARTASRLAVGAAGVPLIGGATPSYGQVVTAGIADNAVTTDKISDDAVTTAEIADNAITQAQMADNSVGTAEIVDAAVTNDKLSAELAARSWGEVAYTESLINSGTFTAVTDLNSLAWTAVEGRKYKITCACFVQTSAADAIVRIYLTDGSNTILQADATDPTALGNPVGLICVRRLTGLTAGAQTHKMRGLLQSGSGNATRLGASTWPAYILVEDIGAA